MGDASKNVSWTRYCFDQVGYGSSRWIELNDKTLLSLLDVHGRGRVHEPKPVGAVHGLHYAVENHRPQTGRVNFDSYQLPDRYLSTGVQHLHPSQIELLPTEEGVSCGLKRLRPLPEVGSRNVMSEPRRWGATQQAVR